MESTRKSLILTLNRLFLEHYVGNERSLMIQKLAHLITSSQIYASELKNELLSPHEVIVMMLVRFGENGMSLTAL